MTIATANLAVALPERGACAACGERLRQTMSAIAGVVSVAAGRTPAQLVVSYEAERLSAAQVRSLAETAAAELSRSIGHATLPTAGLDCADCASVVERGVTALPGVISARAHLLSSTVVVEYRAGTVAPADLAQRLGELGYAPPTAVAAERRTAAAATRWRLPASLWPTVAAALLWAAASIAEVVGASELVAQALFAAAIAVGGWRIARSGLVGLVRARTVGIDLLMTIAVVGAVLIGEWAEGAAVVVLFALGEALEGLTVDRARRAIRAVMALAPRRARRRDAAGHEEEVAVEALLPGDMIVVRPGEQVAADGRVVSGSTSINQAAITGESLPVAKAVGDEVYAGTLNGRGSVDVTVTRPAAESALARIVALVEAAQANRAPAERFVDRFARAYTPAVLVLAALVALVPALLGQPWQPWLYRALMLLVIACPCALVISTPVAVVAGLTRASRAGALIKGGAHLEALAGVQAVALDKTGTLTEGRPTVTDVLSLDGQPVEEALALAAAVESRSEHPLAAAIMEAARGRGLCWLTPTDFEALPGRGARATVGGREVTVGAPDLVPVGRSLADRLVDLQAEGKTALLVLIDGRAAAIIAVADRLRPEAAAAVAGLRDLGLRPIVVLTGDNRRTAEAVARQAGADAVRAELLPADKAAAVAELQAANGRLAMVGDGVNDAPALAAAGVGVAMGAIGSDAALEAADIALMTDDLTRLPFLIRLGRATLATIRANVAFAVLVKVAFLVLAVAGVGNLWLAILADSGAALLVVAYSLRLLAYGGPVEVGD